MEERVSISVSEGVADVRLVRADKMNALDQAMFDPNSGYKPNKQDGKR